MERAARIEHFLGLPKAGLKAALAAGHPVDPARLENSRYRGISLGLPGWVDRLAWKTFEKDFHRDPATGALGGWNVRLEQTGWDGPPSPVMKKGAPLTFGHFAVVEDAGRLLLDYGRGANPALDPTRLIRDPVVALEPGGAQWLLGWTYVVLFGGRLGTPSYFLLERVGPLAHVPS